MTNYFSKSLRFRFSLATMIVNHLLIIFSSVIQCCFAEQYYFLSGEVATTGRQASGEVVTTESRFVVASAKEVCLSGISTGDRGESFLIAGESFDRLSIETSLLTGEAPLEAKAKRRVDNLIEQGKFDPSKPPLYQAQTISSVPLAIFFSSSPSEIEVSRVLAGEASFSNDFGTLKVERDGNKIRSISHEKTAGQLLSVDSPSKLKDFRSKLYKQGVKRILANVVFDPYVSFEEPAPWTAKATIERLPVSTEEVASRSELYFVVTDFKVGEQFARRYVDSILSSIPDGTTVVRNGAVLYEWRGGKKTAAVDFSALRVGEDLSFEKRGWSINSIVTVSLLIVVVLSSLVWAVKNLSR